MVDNRTLARGLARQVLGDIMVAATEGDEAARDVIDFKDEILDGWENAIRELLDKKDEQLTPDPLGLAARVVVLTAALREARIDIKDWSSYASSYMRERWDLDGDLQKIDAALVTPSPAVEAILEGLRAVAEVCEESLERRYIDDWWFNFKEDFPALAAGLEKTP